MPPGRPRAPTSVLSVPCDTHGMDPCPSTDGCLNRRERAGLPIARRLGKREARRLAASNASGWISATLDVGAPILGRDGEVLDPDGRDYDQVRDALEELLAELATRSRSNP